MDGERRTKENSFFRGALEEVEPPRLPESAMSLIQPDDFTFGVVEIETY
jgi:hypothetical protein